MMRPILKGSTDQSVVIRIVDSTDGTPETGVVYNTSGIDLWYRREGATKTSITEATLSALNDAHSDGGVLHIGDGYYRLDLPDAAVASGANGVMVGGTVTGMVVIGCYVPLVDYNPYDGVRMGLTALPNAAADAAGGLIISDAGGLDADAQRSDVAAILVDTGTTLDARIPAALGANGNMKADIRDFNGAAGTFASGRPEVNATHFAGTAYATALAAEVDAVLDEVVLGSYTMRQLLRGIAAATVGKLSGAATTTIVIRSADDAKDVITATVDSNGNRSAVTLDLT